jgi:hypothetical protein
MLWSSNLPFVKRGKSAQMVIEFHSEAGEIQYILCQNLTPKFENAQFLTALTQTILQYINYSFEMIHFGKNLLNFSCFTMKFYNHLCTFPPFDKWKVRWPQHQLKDRVVVKRQHQGKWHLWKGRGETSNIAVVSLILIFLRLCPINLVGLFVSLLVFEMIITVASAYEP